MRQTSEMPHPTEHETTPSTLEGPSDDEGPVDGSGIAPVDGGTRTSAEVVPAAPESLEEAGLSEEFVGGLILKTLHVRGATLGFDLVDVVALPMSILDDVLQQLQERRFIEVHSTRGPRRGEYVFTLTGAGRKRALEEMEVCRYVGPAPVPMEAFRHWVERQTMRSTRVTEEELGQALEGIVVPDGLLDVLGPAVNSGSSLFLFGEPGNGKTLLAERLARAFGDTYYVPFSVLVDGSVMIVHDPVHHRMDELEAESEATTDPDDEVLREIVRSIPGHDRRYARARRPVVVTGGELTLHQLDLQWDPTGRMYQAPPQLKAAGGVLVVDDLGRQRVPVRDLLNRWVVPLEHAQDYLTLRSGRKLVVPFDCFVIFSTNLEPRSLADEAFLRRIHYKIEVGAPDRAEYEGIFRACCVQRGIEFDEDAVEYLFEEVYARGTAEPRRCHPRDVLDHLVHLTRYRGEPARLERDLLEEACGSYFLPLDRAS